MTAAVSVYTDMQLAELALREALAQPEVGARLEAVNRLLNSWPSDALDAMHLVVAGRLAFHKD